MPLGYVYTKISVRVPNYQKNLLLLFMIFLVKPKLLISEFLQKKTVQQDLTSPQITDKTEKKVNAWLQIDL